LRNDEELGMIAATVLRHWNALRQKVTHND
jgi:hypothetical protein